MSQELWVAHEALTKRFGPTRVSIEGCDYIDDFLKEIRKESQLAIPQNTPITLYKSDGTTEIDGGDSPTDYWNGNSSEYPLIVKSVVSSIQVPIDLGLHKLTTVKLHIYAPRAA